MSDDKYIVYSRDGKYFHEEPELVEEMRQEWEESKMEQGGYYTGEMKDIDVTNLVSSCVVDEILERMEEALYDIVGEIACDAISLSDEKKAELNSIITSFMKDNCSCSYWAVKNVKYHSFNDEGIEQ